LEVVEKWWTTFGGSKKTNGNISSKPKFSPLKKKNNGEKNKPSIYHFLFKKFLLPQCENSPPKKKKTKYFTIILNYLLIWKISILNILWTKKNFKRKDIASRRSKVWI
jgi:hypothetical protein